MTIFEEIKNLLLKYDRPDQYKLTIELVMDRGIESEIEQLIRELYEQMVTNDLSCRILFGNDLVDKIFEYKGHKWQQGIEYWYVEYRNTEGEPRWSVIKCLASMGEDEIKSRMMDDSEVAEVYSLVITTDTDYGRDFTTNYDD